MLQIELDEHIVVQSDSSSCIGQSAYPSQIRSFDMQIKLSSPAHVYVLVGIEHESLIARLKFDLQKTKIECK